MDFNKILIFYLRNSVYTAQKKTYSEAALSAARRRFNAIRRYNRYSSRPEPPALLGRQLAGIADVATCATWGFSISIRQGRLIFLSPSSFSLRIP